MLEDTGGGMTVDWVVVNEEPWELVVTYVVTEVEPTGGGATVVELVTTVAEPPGPVVVYVVTETVDPPGGGGSVVELVTTEVEPPGRVVV